MKLNVQFSKTDSFTQSILQAFPDIQVGDGTADLFVYFDDWNPRHIEELARCRANILVCTEKQGGIVSYDLCWMGGSQVAWCKPELQSLAPIFGKYMRIKELMTELASTKKPTSET